MLIARLHLARSWSTRLFAADQGSTAIEYALIASLISLGIMAGLTGTGNSVAGSFNYVMTEVASALGND